MSKITIGKETIKSVKIGGLCIFTYLVSYVARNILSVVTPILTKNQIFTKEYVGLLTSVYLIVYASGQLLNGILGDRIRSKYMIFVGCLFSGAGMIFFPITASYFIHIASFATLGLGLSMLRGPLMKIIAENTLPKTARTICVLFVVASFAGPLIASLLSMLMPWRLVFIVTAAFAFSIAVISYILISILEKQGVITFVSKKENIFKSVGSLFTLEKFVFYLIVGGIVEIATSSITFWIPTYLSEYLSMSQAMISAVFSVMALLNVFSPFLCVFIFEHIIRDDIKLVGFMFLISALSFIGLIFTMNQPILNVLLFCIIKITTGCASTALWSIYIPGLAKYGKVSSGNGVFDFMGYLSASVANTFFTGAVAKVGWNGLIVVWTAIMAIGTVCAGITMFLKKRKIFAEAKSPSRV